MGSPSLHKLLLSCAGRQRLPVVTSRIRKPFLIFPLFTLFAFSLWFSQPVIAAPTSPEAQATQSPKVIFEKGLLTVEAEDVKLKALMEAISQKAGIGVSVSESLQDQKVDVIVKGLSVFMTKGMVVLT